MAVMEIAIATVLGGCFAYLVSEINVMQKEVKQLTTKVAVLESVVRSRRQGDRVDNI